MLSSTQRGRIGLMAPSMHTPTRQNHTDTSKPKFRLQDIFCVFCLLYMSHPEKPAHSKTDENFGKVSKIISFGERMLPLQFIQAEKPNYPYGRCFRLYFPTTETDGQIASLELYSSKSVRIYFRDRINEAKSIRSDRKLNTHWNWLFFRNPFTMTGTGINTMKQRK